MNEKAVKLGLIGLGPRGRYLMETLIEMKEIEIVAICDIDPNNEGEIFKHFDNAMKPRPESYINYHELLAREDICGVIIASNWITHVEIAVAAMKAGKCAGVEVGGVASIEECWQLVRVSEETGIPCMMLENCCYGKYELTVFNMLKKGLFGEIVHCECGYAHDLRNEMMESTGNRLLNNMHRNGDLYPTHGMGPIAKMLGINRGNRFVSLTSMASKAAGFKSWIRNHKGSDHPLADYTFTEGDVVQTMVKCAHGETVLITHNVSLPRPYSRFNSVQGTCGIYLEDVKGVFIEGKTKEENWDSIDDYYEQYGHPLWKQYEKEGVIGGHGGMDYLIMAAFAESVRNKTQPPIDVYDVAVLKAFTVLSEQSISLGSASVAFPDFTKGKWIDRIPAVKSKYSLDNVYEEFFGDLII